MGWPFIGPEDPFVSTDLTESSLVDITRDPVTGHASQSGRLTLDNLRCQSPKLGGSLSQEAGPGQMACNGDQQLQPPRTASNIPGPAGFQKIYSGSPSQTNVRQSNGSSLYSPTGKNQEPAIASIGNQDFSLGQDSYGRSNSSLHYKQSKTDSRPAKPEVSQQQ